MVDGVAAKVFDYLGIDPIVFTGQRRMEGHSSISSFNPSYVKSAIGTAS